MREVIIIGAGLSGLTAALAFRKKGIQPLVIEARERWGGRILTVAAEGKGTPVEMGATWFTSQHQHLIRLLEELSIPFYPQYLKGVGVFETSLNEELQLFRIPETVEPSYRMAGGTSALTEALVERLGREELLLGSPIEKIAEQEGHLKITGSKGLQFACKKLIITIPPFLLAQKIAFTPELPAALSSVMENTHTWMGEAIKFAVEYKNPFWRQHGLAGAAFSHVGIVREVHDHCNFEGNSFALKGFLSEEAIAHPREKREAEVIAQLERMLGKEAKDYLSYTEKVWKEDPFTFTEYKQALRPHQYNGHPLYSRPLMNGKLILAGTETSSHFGGYLEGAVYSGLAAAHAILDKMPSSTA
ncbi:flavin monoamine oxidase family protein [Nafulsella turpanensis]|uniref:flavin monoamine oxidase family protein n=1 Tax=Nafulsella turpanensis TaxID=1265690 RepID=UPI000347C277|nr:NAD(P)/FAD-dependent oxidoreductase [Nafulsella turpanensis]